MRVSGRADSASTTVPVERMPDHVEAQEADIAAVDERIEAALAPFVGQVELPTAIPGSTTAPRRSSSPASAPTWPPFPPPGTWRRGLGCARANATRPADPARARPARGPRGLRGALVQCASAASRTKGTYCPNAAGIFTGRVIRGRTFAGAHNLRSSLYEVPQSGQAGRRHRRVRSTRSTPPRSSRGYRDHRPEGAGGMGPIRSGALDPLLRPQLGECSMRVWPNQGFWCQPENPERSGR
jgi:hypothetical protein